MNSLQRAVERRAICVGINTIHKKVSVIYKKRTLLMTNSLQCASKLITMHTRSYYDLRWNRENLKKSKHDLRWNRDDLKKSKHDLRWNNNDLKKSKHNLRWNEHDLKKKEDYKVCILALRSLNSKSFSRKDKCVIIFFYHFVCRLNFNPLFCPSLHYSLSITPQRLWFSAHRAHFQFLIFNV